MFFFYTLQHISVYCSVNVFFVFFPTLLASWVLLTASPQTIYSVTVKSIGILLNDFIFSSVREPALSHINPFSFLREVECTFLTNTI